MQQKSPVSKRVCVLLSDFSITFIFLFDIKLTRVLVNILHFIYGDINRRLVSSVGRAPDCRAGGLGFEPQTGPTLRVLK